MPGRRRCVWLVGCGWDDLFLDIDPKRGIVAGERSLDALEAAGANTGEQIAQLHHGREVQGTSCPGGAIFSGDESWVLTWGTSGAAGRKLYLAQVWDTRFAAQLRGRAPIRAICNERLTDQATNLPRTSLRHITPGDAEAAPILRSRMGEDVRER